MNHIKPTTTLSIHLHYLANFKPTAPHFPSQVAALMWGMNLAENAIRRAEEGEVVQKQAEEAIRTTGGRP